MGTLISIIFILGLSPALAGGPKLRVGDVLLQPMRCYLCGLIEAHEDSPFAHMGVVVRGGPTPQIAESLGVVRVVSLESFLAKGDLSRAVVVRRPREDVGEDLDELLTPWLGASYDDDFRWDNLGPDGREAFYCSELVTKLLNLRLRTPVPTKIMNYDRNRSLWERYFGGPAPDGLPGNSPGDFGRSPLFRNIGSYQGGVWSWN